MTTAAPTTTTFRDYFIRLFEYDRWANARVIAAMESLADRLPQKPLDRLSHLLVCQKTWAQRMRDEPNPNTVLFPTWSLEELKTHGADIAAMMKTFLEEIADEALQEEFEYRSTEGAVFRNRRADILTQLSQHGCYHRGQIAVELNPLLPKPLVTDYVFFCRRA